MEITTGLTAAWLDAVRRAQSDMTQRFAKVAPDTASSYQERTLTDVIERAVKAGGATPPPESKPPSATAPAASATTVPAGTVGRVLDIKV
ncbi:hypothetical protein [Rhodoplanes roseus]|uniref:Uncharacterized protein n=1 Tax=Rhodoplanes roseus TaxID=29409 RepID=A0A327L8D0_9BRAD|nr:hypothetical protein [Rhodoplanes roseus]RAI45742.1 hypothetical protein CH341_02230 [Rhodoplanes roseus]